MVDEPRTHRAAADLTSGPVGPTLIAYSLPALGANLLQTVNISTNAVWVSHLLGEAALTAISNVNQILFVLVGAIFGLTTAANILIAQSMGAEDVPAVRSVTRIALVVFLALSLVVALAGLLLARPIVQALGVPADAQAFSMAYLRVTFCSTPFMFLVMFLQAAMRAVGDARGPFYFSLLTVGLTVVLNPLLILGSGPLPALGIAGSGLASLLALAVTLGTMVWRLYGRGSVLAIPRSQLRPFRPDPEIVRPLFASGLPIAGQMVAFNLSGVVLIGMVNGYGSLTAAAYGAALQIWTYLQMPSAAIGVAVTTIAAHNIGAARLDRVRRVAAVGAAFSTLATVVPIVAVYLAGPWIMRGFLPAHSGAAPIALHINGLVAWTFALWGVSSVYTGILRAAGAVLVPLLALILGMWVVRLPFALLLQPVFGAEAIWWSYPLGTFVNIGLVIVYYHFGSWARRAGRPSAASA